MEGAILSTQSNSRFRTHLKNASSALCARTLPKQRRSEPASCSTTRHHTYPRATPHKRAAIVCQPFTNPTPPKTYELTEVNIETLRKPNGVTKWKGNITREVASAWGCRVGRPDEPAPADRVQSIFNDIELYPTKTQVFEMLVCARQCARRKSLNLTFGEFCAFAVELRRCSQQAKQNTTKPESPVWTAEKDILYKQINGSEASPPPCEVFLGGSCNPTTWRSKIAIPMLKEMGITYFNPQVENWSSELVEVEYKAKVAARALLFVLDSETRAVAASVEAADLAASPRDLLLVLKPFTRHQTIGNETISDQEYIELSRARATLQEVVERRGLPVFSDIPAAVKCARAVICGARTYPRHSLGQTILRLKRTYDAAGGRSSKLPRGRAVDALREVTRAQREVIERSLPAADAVDFETFCVAVAELAADSGGVPARGAAGGVGAALRRAFRSLCDRLSPAAADADCHGVQEEARADVGEAREKNGLNVRNARLRAYGRKLGLYIPKNNGASTTASPESGTGAGSSESVFTPGTERRLQRLPAMLGAPIHDVYLGGAFPSDQPRPEEFLRREKYTYIVPRANDYTRMFSAPARRAASAHPESPCRDKKPRPAEDDVQLRDRSAGVEPSDRLSASDFYKVTEDITPQPFKGTYDEDLLLGSRVLVFSLSAEAPSFATMVLAAHYMGLRPAATVLLVQQMSVPSSDVADGSHCYSETAVKDYNRGRTYLADLARRAGVAVFDNVQDTMACVLQRLTANNTV